MSAKLFTKRASSYGNGEEEKFYVFAYISVSDDDKSWGEETHQQKPLELSSLLNLENARPDLNNVTSD